MRIALKVSLLLSFIVMLRSFASADIAAEVEYFYAKDGTIIGRAVNGVRSNFEYDAKGQLLSVKDAKTGELRESYIYDPAGNILSKTVYGETTIYTYDASNQLVSANTHGTKTAYAYDAAGRLIRAGGKSYRYGFKDKVLEVRDGAKTRARFSYYMDGQLKQAKYADRTESFMWDGLALVKRDSVNFINEPHVTGGNPVLAGNSVMFNDMLGSTLAVDGKSIDMTAFGDSDDPAAMFTGKPQVEELGHVFLFRNYRAELGKWQTADPLGYPDGWNQLAYCNNKVESIIDWMGLAGNLIIVGEGGASGGMFDLAASTYQRENGGTIVNVSSGREMIVAINNFVQNNGTIDSLQIFSHSSNSALYFDQGANTNNSFYSNGIDGTEQHANVSDLPTTAMSENGIVKLWGCNTNANSGEDTTIAQQIANQLQRNVEAASGPTVFTGVPNGLPNQGLPDTVPANYTGNVYLVPHDPHRGFSTVRPE